MSPEARWILVLVVQKANWPTASGYPPVSASPPHQPSAKTLDTLPWVTC